MQTYAAVDLGSNSFHMLVVCQVEGEVRVLDKLRTRVRLAKGLTDEGHIAPDAKKRALECLTQFGHRLSKFEKLHVRVVGTNTLRRDPSGEFLKEAQRALGHPIQVISGLEEARLVYLGVSHDIQDDGSRRLVIDIGGGSTECIVGQGSEILQADSLYMGCVGYTQRFFGDGRITHRAVDQAVVASRLEVGSIKRVYRKAGWTHAFGSSGTINAVQSVLRAHGRDSHRITAKDLDWLTELVGRQRSIEQLELPGLKAERAPVFPGGVCILNGLFKAFRIDEMTASESALREGVIYDLLGQDGDSDVRESTVIRMRERYGADPRHADRVRALALRLADTAFPAWGITNTEYRKVLSWACDLHEIGKALSYAGYHRHGAYLIANSEMVGFSRSQKLLMAALVLGQRRQLDASRVYTQAGVESELVLRLVVLLRLASRLNRTRSPRPRPIRNVRVTGQRINLEFPEGWLDERPLTQADLVQEASYLSRLGFTLEWS